MAHELSTIGCGLKWAVETTAGTRPTTGYTALTGVKSEPATADAPNNLQVTDLSDHYHRYVPGVQDVGGGTREYLFNDTAENRTAWAAMVTAYETAVADGKSLWIEETFPGGLDSFYYAGIPSEWVSNERSVDSVLEATGYITANLVAGFATAST